ncbi:hypothetical protein ACFL6X_09295 [Candidatus Latescibacterota bacterium]
MTEMLTPAHLEQLLSEGEEPWRKNRKMVKRGYSDLVYLPKSKTGWNVTLAAFAFSQRLNRAGHADLNEWAAMHGCPASARYAELGDSALVLWHGTSDERAERIREVGLFHKRGLWSTTEPRVAHGYTRGRSRLYGTGSATVVLVLDRGEIEEGVHYSHDNEVIYRFHSGLRSRHIQYILWGDRLEFRGDGRAREPNPWGQARFKRQGGRWVPLSRPPVRLDSETEYGDFDEWLTQSITRIVRRLGEATAVEVFSSLYATLDPWRALEHEAILARLEEQCTVRRGRPGPTRFSPP